LTAEAAIGIEARERALTEGSLNRAIWELGLPMTLEMTMMSIFQLFDLFGVGPVSAAALAAVTVSGTLQWSISALSLHGMCWHASERKGKMGEGSKRLGKCYGTTTVSERGQIVVPAEARRELGIKCGTKLVVFRSGSMGGRGLVLMTANTVTEFVREAVSRLTEFERAVLETTESEQE